MINYAFIFPIEINNRTNGKKTMFEFNKHDFEPKSLEKIFEQLGRMYE